MTIAESMYPGPDIVHSGCVLVDPADVILRDRTADAELTMRRSGNGYVVIWSSVDGISGNMSTGVMGLNEALEFYAKITMEGGVVE